jgi:endonuclease YncB( thermonuclease family)
MTEIDWGIMPAVVLDVHDGDTIKVDCDRGLETRRSPIDLRLNGTSAPELKIQRVDNPPGIKARARVLELCPVGSTVLVRTIKTRVGTERTTLGRYVADVFYADKALGWVSLNETLITEGLARAGSFVG